MLKNFLKKSLITAISFIILCSVSTQIFAAESVSYKLDNGMEIILKEKHGSPMIASIIFVKSGSKYETKFENGITHFLEHLLFNGTTSLSREDIDGSIRDLGGYINAFTRKDMTAFMVLMPKQYIDYGLTVQVDMLFNSLIIEKELSKERKVVIEEIKSSADSPGSAAYDFFNQIAYAGTPYSREVLGYESFIANIPKEAIIQYWKSSYRPDNMTALIIGDFETDKMKEVVAKILGSTKADQPVVDSTQVTDAQSNVWEIESKIKDYSLTEQTIIDTTANVKSTYIIFSFDAPHFTDSAYLPMDLLSQYLAMDEVSPLKKALKSGATPLADEVYVFLDTYEEFSRFEISVITSNADNRDQIVDIILNQVKNISKHNADNEVIEGIKISTKTSEIYYSDKLHYYAFIIAPMMMTAGWDYIQEYPELINTVNWEDCKKVAENWLDNPNYIATVVKPNPEGVKGFTPRSLTVEEVTNHFDSAKFDKYNLMDKEKINYPQTDSVNFEIVEKAKYHRETLHNGLTVIIKSHPDSRVFALNVLGKNRTANEPDGKDGITDFVNRCIEKGTVTRNSFELSRDLSKIGANITLYDNPWIPYDDRYTTRQYSFMKFETIDDFAEKGFHLFTEMILYPSFDSIEVENVRQQMMGVLGRNSVSPRKVARNLFYSTLFGNSSFAKPIMGTMRSIGSITAEDLKDYHAKFYSPENMIISIVSNKPISEVMSMVNQRFGSLVPNGFASQVAQEPEPFFEIKSAHSDLDKEQISIFLGGILPGASSEDAAAIAIASSILSSRLYLNLREKDGLAYSVGSGARLDKNFGWYYSVIGTGYENYQKAVDGILLQIDKLKYDGPEIQEINKARNQMWGRLMRAKLSNINQAYYLCLDEYLGHPAPYDNQFIKELSKIDINKIRQVFAKYYKTDTYVITSAGKKP